MFHILKALWLLHLHRFRQSAIQKLCFEVHLTAPPKQTHPVDLFDMASNIIVRCYVGQACSTWDRTIMSDAMSNKFCLMGLSGMGLDNGVQSRLKPPCLRGLFDMGLEWLYDPMSDNICPMSNNPSDRLFDSFESFAKPCSPSSCSEFFAKQANDLLAESRPACFVPASPMTSSSPSRPMTCSAKSSPNQSMICS
jgi:hypothetical protein